MTLSTALRVLRTLLSIEALAISLRTYRGTRDLERRRQRGDQSVKNAVGITPQSRLFGVPNGLSACLYFLLMAVLSAGGLVDRRWTRPPIRLLSCLSLGVSGYLTYQLLFVLRRSCPLCIRTHVLNLALTLALNARADR
jgi:uncharacterized membrane protein